MRVDDLDLVGVPSGGGVIPQDVGHPGGRPRIFPPRQRPGALLSHWPVFSCPRLAGFGCPPRLTSLGTFDLVHSFIVFQHIPERRGEAIARRLVSALNPGGVGVLHFAYATKPKPWTLRDVIGHMITPALRLFVPILEMHPYDLNRLCKILQDCGIGRLHVELTDHDYYGALLFFQR